MSARKRRSGISRRTLLQAGAFMSAYPAPRLLAQTSEPLRIGFLTVLTGPLAAGGQQQQEGAGLFLNERNGMIAGRKVELITQDTGGNPAQAKTKTQELVERHKVPVMIGPLATNEAIAMDGYIRDTKVPLITTTSAATVDLKSHAVNPWVLHAFGTAPQVTYPLGDYAAKTLGFKKVAIVAEDFTYGHEGAGGFHLAFEGRSCQAGEWFERSTDENDFVSLPRVPLYPLKGFLIERNRVEMLERGVGTYSGQVPFVRMLRGYDSLRQQAHCLHGRAAIVHERNRSATPQTCPEAAFERRFRKEGSVEIEESGYARREGRV